MRALLKFEWRKLTRGRAFYICSAIMLVALLLEALLIKDVQNRIDPIFYDEFSWPGFKALLEAVNRSYYLIVAGIFTAIYLCDDFDQNTLKNVYSRGYTRLSVISSKLITVFASASAMFIIVELFGFTLASLLFGVGEGEWGRLFSTLAVLYVSCMANVAFFAAASLLIRKKGLAITAVIVGPIIIELLLSVLDVILKLEDFFIVSLWVGTFPSSFLTLNVDTDRMLTCLFASVAYIALFAAGSIFFNRKNEI